MLCSQHLDTAAGEKESSRHDPRRRHPRRFRHPDRDDDEAGDTADEEAGSVPTATTDGAQLLQRYLQLGLTLLLVR